VSRRRDDEVCLISGGTKDAFTGSAVPVTERFIL
jgi:hypothetical protein